MYFLSDENSNEPDFDNIGSKDNPNNHDNKKDNNFEDNATVDNSSYEENVCSISAQKEKAYFFVRQWQGQQWWDEQ